MVDHTRQAAVEQSLDRPCSGILATPVGADRTKATDGLTTNYKRKTICGGRPAGSPLAPHAGMLRRLLDGDSHASQIARAIAHIRKNLVEAVSVEELSKIAGMSVRSFHEHFKRITETTPLQYQKELRLIEAKRLLQGTEHTVGSTAFEIGYESPTQFSRDYSRRFGVSPREHLKECQ